MSRTTAPTAQAPALGFATPYPSKRPAFLCVKVMRLLVASNFCEFYGHLAEKLVMVIVAMEDQFRYQRAIVFRDEGLMRALGVRDWASFDAIRRKAVESGFLVHNAPQKHSRRPHTYFVKVPDDLQDLTDFIPDDGPATRSADSFGSTPSDTPNVHPSVQPSSPQVMPQASPQPFIPVPVPTPDPVPPPPSTFRREEEEFAQERTEEGAEPARQSADEFESLTALAKSLGCKMPEGTIKEAFRLGASPGHVRAVLRWIEPLPVYTVQVDGREEIRRKWGGGAIRWRLTHPELLPLPPGEGWAKPDADWTRLHAAAQEAERRKNVPQRAAAETARIEAMMAGEPEGPSGAPKMRQLEFDFGQKLDHLTRMLDTAEILRLCRQAGGESAKPAVLSRVETQMKAIEKTGGRLSGIIRARVLEAMATVAVAETN